MKKRIALSIVAALAGGLLAAAPASAAVGDFTVVPAAPTIGGYATVGFDGETNTTYTVFLNAGTIGDIAYAAASPPAPDSLAPHRSTGIPARLRGADDDVNPSPTCTAPRSHT